MKKLILSLALFLLAAPAFAGRKACNTTLVNQTICRVDTNIAWHLDFQPTTDSAKIGDNDMQHAFAFLVGWTAQVVCTQARVDLAQCTAPQLGTLIDNPETEKNAAVKGFKKYVHQYVSSYLATLIDDTKRGEATTAKAAIPGEDSGQ